MKKRMLSLLLAAVLLCSLTVGAWAVDGSRVQAEATVQDGVVTLVLYAGEDTFNGNLRISYDRGELVYVETTSDTTVYSAEQERGNVTLGYALSTANTLRAGAEIARLHFTKNGDWLRSYIGVTVENWNEQIGLMETQAVAIVADGSIPPVGPEPQPEEPDQPDQPQQPEQPQVRFDDVIPGSWYEDAVYDCVEKGYLKGIGNNLFGPGVEMNRAMLVTLLARREGVDTSVGSPWYAAGQAWAMENGVSDGTNMTANITREQLVTMLYRYAQLKGYDVSARADLSTFADADTVSVWAKDAMEWAVAVGLISGTEQGLEPGAAATRAQVALVICRFDALVK